MTVSALTRPGERDRLVVKFGEIDWIFCLAITLIAGAGAVMQFSIAGSAWMPWAAPHLARYAVFFAIMIVLSLIDIRVWFALAYPVYGVGFLLLIAVMFVGHHALGAQRWLQAGPIQIQPSEIMKVGLVLALARFYHSVSGKKAQLSWWLLVPGGLILAPVALVMEQPDLGTAMLMMMTGGAVMVLAGLSWRLIAVGVLGAVAVIPPAVMFVLHDYQRKRILTFMDPEKDPQNTGYQTIQARITVGSGGFKGKGFLHGTQGQYKFLPVAHNDFIFSVLAEEQGFIGVLGALGLYLFVILRSLEAARLAKDRLGAYLVGGIITGFAFQVVYNVTMSAGLAPVKGITLPLMSYGGSSLIATLAGFGLILNVRMRRFTN